MKTALFAGFSKEEVEKVLSMLHTWEAFYAKNDIVLELDVPVSAFGIVKSGRVQVATYDIHGDKMIMAVVEPSGVFAESLAFTGVKNSPVYATALEECCVLWVDVECVRSAFSSSEPLLQRLGENFTRSLASKVLVMNNRVQILSKKTIREKVNAFFTFQVQQAGCSEFEIPFDRSDLADYLGVERSALSRVLSQMQEEGLLEFHKNRFRIL